MKANVIWSRVWLDEQTCGSALETEQTWGAGRDGEILLYQGAFWGPRPKVPGTGTGSWQNTTMSDTNILYNSTLNLAPWPLKGARKSNCDFLA